MGLAAESAKPAASGFVSVTLEVRQADDTAVPGITSDSLKVVLTPMELAVDADRDGTIKLSTEDASDAASSAKPYRF